MISTTMDPNNKIIYEYCMLRYVPDVERGEFVNVGLMMMCKRHRWLHVEINVDPERIKALYPAADIDRLRTQLGMFVREDVPERGLPVEERYRWLSAVKSAIIQTSPSHPGIIFDNDNENNTEGNTPKNKLASKFESLADTLLRSTPR